MKPGPQSMADARRGIQKRKDQIRRRNRQITDLMKRISFLAGRLTVAKNIISEALANCETDRGSYGDECARCQTFKKFLSDAAEGGKC